MTSKKRSPIFVSFSGMDGAGKSTQIDALRSWLIATGFRVRVLAFWDDVAVFGRFREVSSHVLFKSEKGIGSPEKPVERRDKNVRAWYMTLARFFLYFADALGLAAVIRKVKRQNDADVIIFDRYLDDEIVNLNLNSSFSRSYARVLLSVCRRPEIAYLLDADPVLARKRKPEYPLEFLHSIRESYISLSRISGDLTMVGSGDVAAVASQIRERFEKLLRDPAHAPRPVSLVGQAELVDVHRVR